MKREAQILLSKALDSLTLSIELFNRPNDRGRVQGVLIFLDHSFEMLLKAAIVHRDGDIRESSANQTIGFDSCVRKALSDGDLRFLANEQALTLQILNNLRDAAQHYFVDLSEQSLYLQSQAGLTLFRDIYRDVFEQDLQVQLPNRVLPLSTTPPVDLAAMFDLEIEKIKQLLQPGKRRGIEASAKLRALAIMEGAINGHRTQPDLSTLRRIAKEIKEGKDWSQIFPGVASLHLTSEGHGPSIDLRLSKKEGIPVHLVPEGTPGAAVVGIKRVSELDFYNLNLKQLAQHVELTTSKTTAMVRYLNLQSEPDCFKEIVVGKQVHKRYSQRAITRLKEALEVVSADDIWRSHGFGRKTG